MVGGKRKNKKANGRLLGRHEYTEKPDIVARPVPAKKVRSAIAARLVPEPDLSLIQLGSVRR